MIDEVYSAQRVEFVRGKFLGCNDNQTTKTVFIFMIKSAGGKYMNVVSLVPLAKMNAEFIYNQYTPIMKTLYLIRFIDVAVSVDNHPAKKNSKLSSFVVVSSKPQYLTHTTALGRVISSST
uniref:Putative LOC100214709 [Hydra vulgaris] n=1 Tax=Lepeophtheirus salmonis TaxID=72036 RepID=A0A0K2V9V0_LEPSM